MGKIKKASKTERTSLDKKIATAASHEERLRLILAGRPLPKTDAERLSRNWAAIRYLRLIRQHKDSAFAVYAQSVEKETLCYAIRALVGNNPVMLTNLAREMRRETRWESQHGFEPDRKRYSLLKGLGDGKGLSVIADELSRSDRMDIDPSDLRRIARKWGTRPGRPGRPQKSDT